MGDALAALVVILVLVSLVVALRVGANPPTVLHDTEGRVIDPAELEGDEPEEFKDRPKAPRRVWFSGRGWFGGGFPWWWGR